MTTTITAYAGQLSEDRKEVEISAEEKSVLDGDMNEAEAQPENEIADDDNDALSHGISQETPKKASQLRRFLYNLFNPRPAPAHFP